MKSELMKHLEVQFKIELCQYTKQFRLVSFPYSGCKQGVGGDLNTHKLI